MNRDSIVIGVLLALGGAITSRPVLAQSQSSANNFIFDCAAPGLGQAEVVITGPGLPEPVKYAAGAKDGVVTRALLLPVGPQRKIEVTLRDRRGAVIGKGKGEHDVDTALGTRLLIPVLPMGKRGIMTASFSTHRVLITRNGPGAGTEGEIQFRAQVFDANGREVPLKTEMFEWEIFGPRGGQLSISSLLPPSGSFIPPPLPPTKPPLDPCLCIAGSTSCPCLEVVRPAPLIAISAGGRHTCALDSANTAYCWGGNARGQVGFPTQTQCTVMTSPYPLMTDCSTTPGFVTGGHAFKAISAGGVHTCAIDTAGQAWCWGYNLDGQLGLGGTTPAPGGPTPQAVTAPTAFVAISAGGSHTCALGSDQHIYCWGKANCGQAGQNVINALAPRLISPTLNFKALSAGDQHNCALTTTGEVMCWGRGDNGQLGFRGNISPSACGNSSTDPGRVTLQPAIGTVAAVAAGGSMSCAGSSSGFSQVSGAVMCWGGQVNDPVGLSSGGQNFFRPVKRLTVGGTVAIADHACAVATDATAWCWGDNRGGLIGVPAPPGQVSLPTRLSQPPAKFKEISAAPLHTCGIDDQDQVWCWGSSDSGQIGDGTQQTRSSPVLVRMPIKPPLHPAAHKPPFP